MKVLDRILVCLYVALAVLPLVAMKLGMHDHEIVGRLPPAAYPTRSWASVRDESYQQAFTAWFESQLGLKGYSIASDNALLYHAFGETKPGSGVVIGRDDVLFSADDIAYFNKDGDALPNQASVDALADKVAAMQQRMRTQHRAFVPLLIPTKPTIYRNEVPAAWLRDVGDPRPAEKAVYFAFKRALDERKVTYVDARDVLVSRTTPRGDLWGKNARHWSYYGACLTMQRVVSAYTQLVGGDPLPYDCPLGHTHEPKTYDDFDLWTLLNAWWPAARDRNAPTVDHVPPVPSPTMKPSVLFVGTSFGWTILKDAERTKLFGAMHFDFYNSMFVAWPQNTSFDIHPHSKEWRDIVLDKDLYILDLFECYLLAPDDTYVDRFLADVEDEVAPPPAIDGPTTGATITAITNRGFRNGAHYFELAGRFPNVGASYAAVVTCDGTRLRGHVFVQTAEQLTLSVADLGAGECDRKRKPPTAKGVSCTFHVEAGTAIGSPVFGPTHVCPRDSVENRYGGCDAPCPP